MTVPELQTPFGKPACCLGIDLMFDGQHARGKGIRRFTCERRETPLNNAWAGVEFVCDEMHCGAVGGVAGLDDAFVGVQARVGR